MKKVAFILCILSIAAHATAQDYTSKHDIRVGIGASLLGSGDMRGIMLENELNTDLGRYFTAGFGLGYGKSDNGVYLTSSFIQGNANLYFSPFTNTRRNDFRIGAGAGWYSVSEVYVSETTFENGQISDIDYEYERRNSPGFNIILENTYAISPKFFIGLKLFTQPYVNGGINTGIVLRSGFNI